MEEKLIYYLLYSVLLEIRFSSYEKNDIKTFELCNLFHNIPLELLNDVNPKEIYRDFTEKIKSTQYADWLLTKQSEFQQEFPGSNKLGL